MKIAVLGAGMVGSAIAIDLSKKFDVTSFDISENNLGSLKSFPEIKTVKADLSLYANYKNLLSGFDLVVSAVPGFMGYNTLEAIIECKKKCC